MSHGKPRKSADPLYLLLREGDTEEFNRRRNAGQACDLRGCDFRGIDLRGVDVSHIDFSDGYFRQADLRGLDLRNCQLHGASLHAAQCVRRLLSRWPRARRDRTIGPAGHADALQRAA